MRGTNERKVNCKSSRNVAPEAGLNGSALAVGRGKNRELDTTLHDSITRL
jgi:hypothetical protein